MHTSLKMYENIKIAMFGVYLQIIFTNGFLFFKTKKLENIFDNQKTVFYFCSQEQ